MAHAMNSCQMCGGRMDIDFEKKVGTCGSCGNMFPISVHEDKKQVRLLELANKERRKGNFEDAYQKYEKAYVEGSDDHEVFWGLALSYFGIEYVEDEKTGKQIPTCHRASWDSFLENEHYLDALKNVDSSSKSLYVQQAEEIDLLLKNIAKKAENEDPYDVFISYKRTDEKNERTLDSVQARKIYDKLSEQGYRVFFAEKTLEGMLGEEYEPIIYAALASAKIMIVVCTSREYCVSRWVKSEWSRFLKQMQKNKDKQLIPAYKDMDAYDLPDDFGSKEAINMGKLGWLTDLVDGVDKLLGKNTVKNKAAANSADDEIKLPLLQRAETFLSLGETNQASALYEQMTHNNPKDYRGWLGLAKVITNDFTLPARNSEINDNVVRNLENALKTAPSEADVSPSIAKYCNCLIDYANRRLKDNLFDDAFGAFSNAAWLPAEEYRAWWGLVLAATENLQNVSTYNDDIKSYYRSAIKRCDESEKATIEAQYKEYITRVEQWQENEKNQFDKEQKLKQELVSNVSRLRAEIGEKNEKHHKTLQHTKNRLVKMEKHWNPKLKLGKEIAFFIALMIAVNALSSLTFGWVLPWALYIYRYVRYFIIKNLHKKVNAGTNICDTSRGKFSRIKSFENSIPQEHIGEVDIRALEADFSALQSSL